MNFKLNLNQHSHFETYVNFLCFCHRPQTMVHRHLPPPTINYQLPTTNHHQPPAINHKPPPTTKHQTSTTIRTTKHQPPALRPTTNHQPSPAINHQPPTINHQPSSTSLQRLLSTNNHQHHSTHKNQKIITRTPRADTHAHTHHAPHTHTHISNRGGGFEHAGKQAPPCHRPASMSSMRWLRR